MAKKNRKSAQTSTSQSVPHSRGALSFWKSHLLPAVLILAAALGLYLSTVSYDYILDDQIVITDNIYTNRGLKGLKSIFMEESFMGYFQKREDLVAGSRYRPLSIATFAIEREFFQKPKTDIYGTLQKDAKGKQLISGDPAVSHFINAVLYALSALLLYRLLCMMMQGTHASSSSSNTSSSPWYLSVPFAATMLFVVHPLHIEVVANIKGRDEIMTLMFSLLALYYSLRYVQQEKLSFLIMTGGSLLLGLLAKENAITFAAIVPLTLYFFTKATKSQYIALSVPIGLTIMMYLMLRYQVIGYFFSGKEITDIMNNPFFGMSLEQKYATVMYTLGLYVKLCFFPHPLTHDYYPYTIPVMQLSDWRTILSLFVYAVLIATAVLGFKRKSIVSYSILLFLIALSIVSNIVVPVGSFMNERFAYISSIGFCVAGAYVLLEFLPSRVTSSIALLRSAGAVVIALGVIALSYTTIHRLPAFKDHFSLNEADIETSSESCRANCFMGVGLYQKYLKESDEKIKKQLIVDADRFLQKSLRIYPTYYAALQMISGVYAEEFKYDNDTRKLLNRFYEVYEKNDKIEFVEQFLVYMNRMGTYADVLPSFYHHLGYDLFFVAKNDRIRARSYAQMGLEIDPNNVQLQNDMKVYGGTVSFGSKP